MPFVNILTSGPAMSDNAAKTLCTNMTQIMAGTAHKQAELTSVRIQHSKVKWSIAGNLNDQPRAHMDIHVTQGTNSEEEIAALVEQGYGELEKAMDLNIATYVIVHEHPAGNWGYGGRTQAARKLDTD